MLYTYEVEYLNEFEDGTPEKDKGVVCALDYSDAVKKIVEYYGEDNIICFDGLCAQEGLLTIDDLKETWRGV